MLKTCLILGADMFPRQNLNYYMPLICFMCAWTELLLTLTHYTRSPCVFACVLCVWTKLWHLTLTLGLVLPMPNILLMAGWHGEIDFTSIKSLKSPQQITYHAHQSFIHIPIISILTLEYFPPFRAANETKLILHVGQKTLKIELESF